MNNLSLSVTLVTAPYVAFRELRERPKFWFPLLLVVASTMGITYWYYSVVDIEWLKDAILSKHLNMPGDQRAAAIGMVTRTTMLWSAVVGAVVLIPVVLLVEALLLLLIAKVSRVELGFKYWFAMVSWSLLPVLLGTVAAAVFLILSDTPQISPGVLQPLSINELLIHRPIGSPGQGLLASLSIPGLLSWVLMIIGVRTWSQRSWFFSATFVLIPILVVYALWAILAFR